MLILSGKGRIGECVLPTAASNSQSPVSSKITLFHPPEVPNGEEYKSGTSRLRDSHFFRSPIQCDTFYILQTKQRLVCHEGENDVAEIRGFKQKIMQSYPQCHNP